MSASARFVAAWFALASCIALASGCSNQGEGERCDLANLNADCSAGLICTRFEVPLCCPPNPQTSSAPQCRQTTTSVPDAGTGTTAIDAGEPSEAEEPDVETPNSADGSVPY